MSWRARVVVAIVGNPSGTAATARRWRSELANRPAARDAEDNGANSADQNQLSANLV